MNRGVVFCLLCVAAVCMFWMVQGTFALGEESEDQNRTYHDQKYSNLVGKRSYARDEFSLMVLHVALEIFNSSLPAGRNTTTYSTMYFPKVDQFTQLRSNFTQAYIMSPNTSVRVYLDFPAQELRSESRLMLYNYNTSRSDKIDLLVGSRAITVNMEQGVITHLYWDDSCSGCLEDRCLEDSCSSAIHEFSQACDDINALEEDPYRCGIKIYVAWKGTDKNNNTLESYTKVPSRFQKYSFIANAYDAASGFATDFISFWKKPLN